MSIHLGSPVAEVRAQQLRLGDDWRDFDAVVVAAELPRASQLLPEIGAAPAVAENGASVPAKWITILVMMILARSFVPPKMDQNGNFGKKNDDEPWTLGEAHFRTGSERLRSVVNVVLGRVLRQPCP